MLKVPYISQFNDNACGAAVLEMVYKFYGVDSSQQELFSLYQELEPHGSGNFRMTTEAIVADAQLRGFTAYWSRVVWGDTEESIVLLKGLIDRGIPVIVCQKFTEEQPLIGHFRIVIGIENNFVHLHDPNIQFGGSNLIWPKVKFMDYWQPTGENVTGGVFCVIEKCLGKLRG